MECSGGNCSGSEVCALHAEMRAHSDLTTPTVDYEPLTNDCDCAECNVVYRLQPRADSMLALQKRMDAMGALVAEQRACLEALVERVKKEWSSPEEAEMIWRAKELMRRDY